MNPATYESLYRRVAFMLTAICVLLVALLAGIVAALRLIEDGNILMPVVLWSLGVVVVLVVAMALSSYRVHRWTIEATGLRIEEKPKIPFAGLHRRAFVAFADMAALRNIESGLDFLIEVAARDGGVFRLMQSYRPRANGGSSGAPQSLQAFAAEIATAASAAGSAPPAITEGLSFWNRLPGLGVILVMLVLSLGIAGAVGWALLDGGLEVHARGGQMTAIALLLPVGTGYLFYKSLKRRQRVLAALAAR